MTQRLIKLAVRSRFFFTPRDRASRQIRSAMEKYLALADSIRPEDGKQPVTVPPMMGVDENMRDWSFFMLLEHNAIVNRHITGIARSLAHGDHPGDTENHDPNKDVMPSPNPGEEQFDVFRNSVEEHLEAVSRLPRLRGTPRRTHAIFGELNAHGWHCMFALHLDVHLKQAEAILHSLNQQRNTQNDANRIPPQPHG